MNGKDLLLGMNDINEKFIEEAETAVWEEKYRKLSLRRPFLIAAIVAMMLLLVGCAVVYVLSLQDMKLGEHTYIQPRHLDEEGNRVYETEIVKDIISLQSVAGSPSFQAAQEWFAFEESYDPDKSILFAADENPFEVSDAYDAYFVYSQEMVDKVDEITATYGLKLAGAMACTERDYNSIFFEQLDLTKLHQTEAAADIVYRDGYFYETGGFFMGWELTLNEEGAWPDSILGHTLYIPRDVFLPSARYVRDLERCRQWTCQVDGQEVLIFIEGDYATAFCQRQDAGISLNFRITGYDEEDPQRMTETDIQRVVECFDFSIQPQKPDVAEANRQLDALYAQQQKEQEAKTEPRVDPLTLESYGEYIQYRIDQTQDPDSWIYGQSPEEIYYGLRDCNGDGVEDLLLGWKEGCFTEIMTLEDGKIKQLFGIGSDNCFLCEGNIIGSSATWEGNPLCEYYRLEGDPFTQIAGVRYLAEKGTWEKPLLDGWGSWEAISEAEAKAITDSYQRIELDMKPLTEYPLE